MIHSPVAGKVIPKESSITLCKMDNKHIYGNGVKIRPSLHVPVRVKDWD